MELPQWEELRGELAQFWLEPTGQWEIERAGAQSGLQLVQENHEGSLSSVTICRSSGSFSYPSTKEVGKHMRGRLRAIWFVSPQITAENPHKWRNPFATSGLSGRASEDAGNELSKELNGMLILSSDDLAQLGAHQLHLISGNPESNRLMGQLRRAVRVAGDTTDFKGEGGLAAFCRQRTGRFQIGRGRGGW